MLAAWYLCSCLGLTIRQSADYLDILEILRSKKSDEHQLAAAVEKLTECEPSLRLHGLAHVLAAARRPEHGEGGGFGVAALAMATRLCDGLVEWAAPADPVRRQTLSELLKDALDGAPHPGYVERVAVLLGDCGQRASAVPAEAIPYQDLGDTVRQTLALTLLVAAVAQDPGDAAKLCVGDDRPEVVTDALANRLGRLPLLVAVDAVLSASPEEADDTVRTAVWHAGQGSADLEPDLLTAAARSWFRAGARDSQDGDDASADGPPDLDDLARRFETELGTGLLLRGWAGERRGGGTRGREVLARLGCGSAGIADARLRTTLWQLVLWELFAEEAPGQALVSAARWWGAPARYEKRTLSGGALAVLPSAEPTDSERQTAVDWIGTMARKPYRPGGAPSVTGRDDPAGLPPHVVCSPWMWRGDNRFSLKSKKEAPPTWYRNWDHLDLLRVTALAPVAVRLLREAHDPVPAADPDGRRPTDPAVAFLFHVKDVFTDSSCRFFLDALRTQSRPDDLTVDVRLAALIMHGHLTVGRAGRGLYPEIPVAVLADFLIDGPGAVSAAQDKGQWYQLFSRPAFNGARDWIRDSAAGARLTGTDEAHGPHWFDGRVPHARRVLTTAVDRLLPLDRVEHAAAAEKALKEGRGAVRQTYASTKPFLRSLGEDFTTDLVPAALAEIDRDWLTEDRLTQLDGRHRGRRGEARRKGTAVPPGLGLDDLLVADRYDARTWQHHQGSVELLVPDPLDPEEWQTYKEPFERFLNEIGAVPLTLQTLRVAALLKAEQPDAIDHGEQWLTSWLRLMDSVTHRNQLGRFIRRAALEMFRTPDRGVAAQDRVRRVLERVVGSVVAFSAEAPRYYQLLLSEEALRPGPGPDADAVRPLPPEGMNRLREQALDAIRRRHWHAQRAPEPTTGPWEVIDGRRARAQIDAQVRAFVAAAAPTPLTSDPGKTLGDTFVRSWERYALTLPGRPGDEGADPRLIVAQGLRHRTGEAWSGLGHWKLAPEETGGDGSRTATDLGPLAPGERRALLDEWRGSPWPRTVLGVVCARGTAPAGAGNAGVRINWGAGSPLSAADGGRLAVGDPCVVQVEWDRAGQGWRQAAGDTARRAGRADPLDGEVRRARVRNDGGTVRVAVDGVPGDAVDGGAAAVLWEPDLSQVVVRPADSAAPEALATLARWDAATGRWLPVDRSLTELVSDDLPYALPDGRRATVLVYAGPGEGDGPEEFEARRFCTVAGRSYLLRPQDWADADTLTAVLTPAPRGPSAPEQDELQTKEAAPAAGMLVYVALGEGADPRLDLVPDPPTGADKRWPALASGDCRDTRNVDWLALFDDPGTRPWRATLDEDGDGVPVWRVTVEDIVGYPTGAGFPPQVAVDGVESGTGPERLFQPRPWDEQAARAARVSGDLLRVQRLDDAEQPPDGARFDEFWQVGPGDTVPVRSLGRPDRQVRTVAATAGAGFPVLLERSGLVYEEQLVVGLAARVTRVAPGPARPGPGATPLADGDLCARLGTTAPPDTAVEGVVVKLIPLRDDTVDSYDVWLRAPGEEPRLCALPAASFRAPVTDVGTTFLGARTPDGWRFTPRQVRGTPLHRVPKADTAPGAPWECQGLVGRPGRQESALYARRDTGELVMAPPPAERPRPRITVRAALGTCPVRDRDLSLVLARIGTAHAVGTLPAALAGRTVAAGKVPITGTHFEITSDDPHPDPHQDHDPDGPADGHLIGLHRCFDMGPGPRTAPKAAQPRPRTRKDLWRQACDAGEPMTETGSLSGRTLVVGDYRIPVRRDDAPFVRAVRYSRTDVRARIVVEDGELVASTGDVPPLDAAEFARHLATTLSAKPDRVCELPRRLHYVGTFREGGQTLWRFEWGRGYTVALRRDELTRDGKPCGEPFPLFHGDQVARLKYREEAGSGRVTIDFRSGDIQVQAGTRVAYEAQEVGFVHQVTVFADPATGDVRIRRVRLTPRFVPRADERYQDVSIAAHLPKADREKVLRLLGDSAQATELCVLARFDHKRYFEENGKVRTFHYVEPRFIGAHDATGPARNRLFMVADGIARDADGTYLTLKLPESVRQPEGTELTVRVSPGDFSVRPNLLPRIHHEVGGDGQDAESDPALWYRGVVFLVEVQPGETPGSWRGVLTSAPARDARTLVSAVRQAGGSLLAVVADERGRTVEILPGVFFELPYRSREFAAQQGKGALVRLSPRGGPALFVGLAQRPDHDYLNPDGWGRAALVEEAASRADGRAAFRVRGLPALSVGVVDALASRLRRTRLPQTAVLRRSGGKVTAVSPGSRAPVRAARVDTGNRDSAEAVLRPLPLGGIRAPEEGPVPWSRLSFADGTAEDIRAQWGRRRPDEAGDTGTAADRRRVPVFFDDDGTGNWTLRYRSERLLRNFALPATALTEIPRPPGPTWYTVAGPARDGKGTAYGLWLELSPGRVIEVHGRLVTGPSGHPLADLAWDRFGPGDQVRLEVVRGALAAPRDLRLSDWRPGPRAAWSAGLRDRVWLPVRPVPGRNGVELGVKHFRCRYPVPDPTSCLAPGGTLHPALPGATAVVLDSAANTLSPAPETGPAPGDCALLGLDPQGVPTLLGLPHRRVELSAPEDGWPGGDWLRELIAGQPAPLLEQLGCLPVTVEQWGEESVTVSRRHQPTGTLPEQATMLCTALAETGGDLVARCGGALHLLPLSEVVPGLPRELAADAARFLSGRSPHEAQQDRPGRRLWCRTTSPDDRDRAPGAPPALHVRLPLAPLSPHADELHATPRGVLVASDRPDGPPHGLLLEAERDRRWHWMPAERASWLPDPTAGELRAALVDGAAPLRVRRLADDTVSVLHVRDVERARLALRPGTRLRVAPAGDRERTAGDPQPTVARALPTGVLVQLRPARDNGAEPGQPLWCEVERLDTAHGRGHVRVVPVGSRRHRVDLPERLAEEYATVAADRQTALRETCAAVEVVAEAYRLPREPDAPLPPAARQALRRWLTEHGPAAYHLTAAPQAPDPEAAGLDLELTDVLAVTLLLDRHGRSSPPHARGAVLLAHHLGLRATRSLHVEPLVRSWASRERLRTDPRLARLRFPAELDDTQLHAVRSYGNGLLSQTDGSGGAHSDAPLARAALAAVGDLPPGEDLAAGADWLAPLAALGRALHPPHGEATAQTALDAGQRDQLHSSLRNALTVPMPLLAHTGTVPAPQQDLARLILEEDIT
ncbi:hypothetical protein SAMN04487983_1001270 [Streptomyces sp. yr375]|uniref:hypothetical protein n=1 Tax=Streptomyces sp. yr375 TaxID=1761906 RepID=UPI0008C1D718|nr:hypothetical protein [Streptomyces sp. yr375]SEP68454.1 hypothetical protein SAMN04487983_1001270 [Streptomyces sp. yr375]